MIQPSDILQVRRLPARLNAEQAATLIGIPASAIPLLIRSKLLRPLGSPAQNSVKVFASSELDEKCHDSKWLDRVTRCIEEHHRDKNKAATQHSGPSSDVQAVAA